MIIIRALIEEEDDDDRGGVFFFRLNRYQILTISLLLVDFFLFSFVESMSMSSSCRAVSCPVVSLSSMYFLKTKNKIIKCCVAIYMLHGRNGRRGVGWSGVEGKNGKNMEIYFGWVWFGFRLLLFFPNSVVH